MSILVFFILLTGSIYFLANELIRLRKIKYIKGLVVGYQYSHEWYLFGLRSFTTIIKPLNLADSENIKLNLTFGSLHLDEKKQIKGYFSCTSKQSIREISLGRIFSCLGLLCFILLSFICVTEIYDGYSYLILAVRMFFLGMIFMILGIIIDYAYIYYCFKLSAWDYFISCARIKNLKESKDKFNKEKYISLINDKGRLLTREEAVFVYKYQLTHVTRKAILPFIVIIGVGLLVLVDVFFH